MRFSKGTLVKVVAFTAASALLTVGLAFEIANVDLSKLFSDRYELEAEFENATGVFNGDSVKLAGVDIGRVTATEIEDGKAIVTFQVDGEVPITSEARVAIRWRNVIGLRFLYVYPASSGRILEDGDRIPITHTDSAGDVGELLNRLGPILKAIDPEKANAFLDAMNTALAGNETIVRALLTEGSALATDLGDMDEQIKDLITSSDKIMGAYAGQNRNIGKIIDDLDIVSGELATMTSEINALIENFAIVQQELEQLLVENRANIDADLSYLNTLLRTLSENRAAFAETLCTLPAGVMPYDMTSGWGEWFNVRIVKFIFKDHEGNEIYSAQETQDQRPKANEVPDTVICPQGTAVAGDFAKGGKSAEQTTSPMHLGPWLDSVTGGDAGG
jgi:phospholipid/cholesterol/gamma-HCH transport system substrate-binding protein